MRHGIVILPQEDWPTAARRWRLAEEYGFDHAWSYDHLSWRSLADQRWHATIPTLTAAAMVTSRIGLGMLVASPNFRHPVPFAKDLATLDDIADGRLLVGVGSGGTGFDAYVLGQPELTPRERHAHSSSSSRLWTCSCASSSRSRAASPSQGTGTPPITRGWSGRRPVSPACRS